MTTERKGASCAIYDRRPQGCREYPKIDSYMPEECTYYFVGNERRGECACGVGACCALPRDGGEPEAKYLPEISGGLPCKHLIPAEETQTEKTAQAWSLSHEEYTYPIDLLVDGPDDS
jgi:Fe-S-cluster containining protein